MGERFVSEKAIGLQGVKAISLLCNNNPPGDSLLLNEVQYRFFVKLS